MIDNFVKLVTLLNDMYSISIIHLASNCLISLFAIPYSPFWQHLNASVSVKWPLKMVFLENIYIIQGKSAVFCSWLPDHTD